MHTQSKRVVSVLFVVAGLAIVGCKKDDQADPNTAYNQQQQQYPQQQYPQQQQQYPQQQYPQQQQQYPQQQQQYPQQPGATGTTGTLAVPGAAATPCSNDSVCLTHKCNVQYGKCTFPCQTDFDCAAGNSCMAGVGACVPKLQ